MRKVDRFVDWFDKTAHKYVWSRIGNIGPGSLKEAKAVHRGVYLGFVKIWTPRGLYRLAQNTQGMSLEEYEDAEKQYVHGVALGCYGLKMGAIWLSIQLGFVSASTVGGMADNLIGNP